MKALVLLFFCASAFALQPADVQIKADPAVTVKVTPRTANTSKTIGVTVNAQDRVGLNGRQVYPASPPASAPATQTCPDGTVILATDACPVAHTNHGAGVYVDPDTTKWAKGTNGGMDVEYPQCHNEWDGTKTICVPYTDLPVPPVRSVPNSGDVRNVASFVGFNRLDPIVFPGQDSAAHVHALYGLLSLTKDTTGQNIRNNCVSVSRGGTMICSGYWMPAMIDTRTHLPIMSQPLLVYYKAGAAGYMGLVTNGVRFGDTIKTWPDGLVMVAGNALATAPQSTSITSYLCAQWNGDAQTGYTEQASIPDSCPNPDGKSTLLTRVTFPQCSDGRLDSPDHKAHMAYPVNDTPGAPAGFAYSCPADHPLLLPQVTFIDKLTLPANGDISKWVRSSDVYAVDANGNVIAGVPRGYTMHGDWMEGIAARIKALWQTHCYDAKADCGTYNNGDGTGGGEFGDN